jgi:serine/threonine-protein kinase
MEAIPSGETSMPFGRYLIRERMAQGGMGEVFLAVAVGADGFEKSVVIKRLLPKFAGRADIVSLLAREAKLMTRLLHPNIVQVIDFGRGQSDDYFLVMELVSGTDLGRFCRAQSASQGRVSPPLALFIAGQMLRGLAYAHATASADGQRLVHRDISPGNVLLSTFGEVKIADFGVALVASSADPGDHDGWLVGKPDYMAPEQLARGGVDERADIYSVGAVLFQTLTGTSHRDPNRAALESVASAKLAQVVSRALAERPEDRFASAREMGRAIDQLVEHGQKLASADDLAEAVAAATPIEPQRSKPVLMLSANEPDSLASGTELRRTGVAGAGDGFTLKIRGQSVRPVLPADLPRSSEPAARSRRWLWSLGIAALSLIGVTVGLGARGDHRDPIAAPPPQGSSVPRIAEQVAVNAPPVVEAPAISSDPPAQRPDTSTGSHPAPRAREPVKELAPSPPSSQEEIPTCRGQVHLYANHGWLVAGGPATVQAPGRYEWPCGTYALRASSRTDDHAFRAITVTVRETAPGVVDLR